MSVKAPPGFQPEDAEKRQVNAPPVRSRFRKEDLYQSALEFQKVDEHAIQVSQVEHDNFTDLIWHLVYSTNFKTEIEKARVIFRWMTSKNREAINFKDGVRPGSPEDVLMSWKTKQGTYANGFEVLCRYAGLTTQVLTGYAKGLDYKPGDHFKDSSYNHCWNAVLIDGSWYLIDAHWATCYLVSEKNLVYEYDDYYFLTDPEHLIYTHWSQSSEWQLLDRPITLQEFEAMPLVKSYFFKCAMYFVSHQNGVISTKNGHIALTLGYKKPTKFSCQIIFADSRDEMYQGQKLKHYGLHHHGQNQTDTLTFRAPKAGAYYLLFFAEVLTGELGIQSNFSLACEYKVIADTAAVDAVPLPLCSGLTWGPGFAVEQLGLVASPPEGVITTTNGQVLLEFRKTRPAFVLCKLLCNGRKEEELEQYIQDKDLGDYVRVTFQLPSKGEYGIEVYGNDPSKDGDTYIHICQYFVHFATPDEQQRAFYQESRERRAVMDNITITVEAPAGYQPGFAGLSSATASLTLSDPDALPPPPPELLDQRQYTTAAPQHTEELSVPKHVADTYRQQQYASGSIRGPDQQQSVTVPDASQQQQYVSVTVAGGFQQQYVPVTVAEGFQQQQFRYGTVPDQRQQLVTSQVIIPGAQSQVSPSGTTATIHMTVNAPGISQSTDPRDIHAPTVGQATYTLGTGQKEVYAPGADQQNIYASIQKDITTPGRDSSSPGAGQNIYSQDSAEKEIPAPSTGQKAVWTPGDQKEIYAPSTGKKNVWTPGSTDQKKIYGPPAYKKPAWPPRAVERDADTPEQTAWKPVSAQQDASIPSSDQRATKAPPPVAKKPAWTPSTGQRESDTPAQNIWKPSSAQDTSTSRTDQKSVYAPVAPQKAVWAPGSAQRETETPATIQKHVWAPSSAQKNVGGSGITQRDSDAPGTEQRGVYAPGTERRDVYAPGTERKDIYAPGTERRDVYAPGTERRDIYVPGTERRDVYAPGTEQKGVYAPGTERKDFYAPDTERRDVYAPGTERKDVYAPGTERRDVYAPGTEQKDMYAPGTERRDVYAPGTERKDMYAPGTERRDIYAPDTERRDVYAPGTERRDVYAPGTERKDVCAPGTERRDVYAPGTERRDVYAPGTERRDVYAPSTEQRDICAPGTERKDIYAPGTERNVYAPGTEQRDIYAPGTERKDVYAPGTERRDVYAPGTEQRDIYAPGTERKDVYAPGTERRDVYAPGTEKRDVYAPGTERRDVYAPGTEQRDTYAPGQKTVWTASTAALPSGGQAGAYTSASAYTPGMGYTPVVVQKDIQGQPQKVASSVPIPVSARPLEVQKRTIGQAPPTAPQEFQLATVSQDKGEAPPPVPAPSPQQKPSLQAIDQQVLRSVDDHAVQVSKSDHNSFRDLVWDLIYSKNITNEIEKVRVIFTWLASKNLKEMNFDHVEKGSPEEVLMGLKTGVTTYSMLFDIMCNYAGLHSKLIGGYAKGVDYKPGMKFAPGQNQHMWNAVCLYGTWCLVDANWGARRLLGKQTSVEDFHYQLDEYFFLTDPHQLIYTHFPDDPRWQLLEHCVTLEEFENMPLMKPQFFKLGLEFVTHHSTVIKSRGEVQVRLRYPANRIAVAFKFGLHFENGDEEYKGIKLDRYGMQDKVDGVACFTVRLPVTASYMLIIYAKEDTAERKEDLYSQVCDFKIEHEAAPGMAPEPYPPCNTSWGLTSDFYSYGLSTSQQSSIICTNEGKALLQIQQPRPMQFMARLKHNSINDADLESHVIHRTVGNTAIFNITAPSRGEYGLQIFASDPAKEGTTLYNIAQYLIVCQEDVRTTPLPKLPPGYLGPQPHFTEFGMATVSHPDPIIDMDSNMLTMELSCKQPMRILANLIAVEGQEDFSNFTFSNCSGSNVILMVSPPQTGFFKLQIFGVPVSDKSQQLPGIYNYLVNCRKVTEAVFPFPKQFAQWKEGCFMAEPRAITCPQGPFASQVKKEQLPDTVPFRVDIPGAMAVAVIVGQDWTHLQKSSGNEWSGNVRVGHCYGTNTRLTLNANYGGDKTNYATLLEYFL